MRIDPKYRWFFFLVFLLGIAIGGYTIKSHLRISREIADAFDNSNATDKVTATDFTEVELAQHLLQLNNQAMMATISLARQNAHHRVVLSILTLFHLIVGIVGLRATASPMEYTKEQDMELKPDGLEAVV